MALETSRPGRQPVVLERIDGLDTSAGMVSLARRRADSSELKGLNWEEPVEVALEATIGGRDAIPLDRRGQPPRQPVVLEQIDGLDTAPSWSLRNMAGCQPVVLE